MPSAWTLVRRTESQLRVKEVRESPDREIAHSFRAVCLDSVRVPWEWVHSRRRRREILVGSDVRPVALRADSIIELERDIP